MSGMIDGVSKFYILYHEGGAMHIEGFKDMHELALQALWHNAWRDGFIQDLKRFEKKLHKEIRDAEKLEREDREYERANPED